MSEQLEILYREAKSALKSRDYARAGELLRQILVIDEDYKDASRLLAQTVKFRRRHWYNHPVLWSALGVLIVFGLGYIIAPRIQSNYFIPAPSATVSMPTTASSTPSQPSTATVTLAPTPILLTWKRISLGQEFPRDTVSAFAVDKDDPDVIYASMDNAGVYKSIDGGLSWKPSHNGLLNTQVVSLVIDFQNPNILYAGTMMDGVYKTEDGGLNWFRIGNGIHLLMDHQDSSHLYARDENAIYETTDQGSNWEMVHSVKAECPRSIGGWAVHPLDGNSLLVGNVEECGSGIFRSDDGGRTWGLIEMKGKTSITAITILRNEQGEEFIFANTESILPEHRGLFVSYDMGKNWRRYFTNGCSPFFPDPENSSMIYCASSGLYVIKVKEGALHRRGLNTMGLTAIHVDRINNQVRILASGTRAGDDTDEGLFISTDGGATWARQSNGLASAQAELKLDPQIGERIYLAYYYTSYGQFGCTLYRSQDTGKSWSEIYSAVGWCGPAFDSTGNFYLLDWYALQMSWDGGDQWLFDSPGYLSSYGLPIPSQIVSANPFIEDLIYAVGDEIYYSEHAGRLWQPASGSDGLWDARLFYKDQGQTVYAIGRYHQKYSTDGGKNWTGCGEELTPSRSDTRLAIDSNGSRLYLATPGQGVMISMDNCQSWQASNDGLSNLFVNTLAVDPINPSIVYAGTDSGAYISFDSGIYWNQINDGLLGATVVYSIAVDRDSNVYAATPYGIFKLEGR